MLPMNIFQIFMDDMEKRQPGFKAKKREERMQKERDDEEQRKALLEKYGSEEAILAPCEKEMALIEACRHLMEQNEYGFWIDKDETQETSVDSSPSESFREAVTKAIPLPETMKEAWAEKNFWNIRHHEKFLFDEAYYEGSGPHLDARVYVVQELLDTLPSNDIDDLLARIDCFYELHSRGYQIGYNETLKDIQAIRDDVVKLFK
jgi:hypothetical protein